VISRLSNRGLDITLAACVYLVAVAGYSAFLGLLFSCSSMPKPCAPQARIEAAYLEAVLSQCKGFTVATCPAVPALKAKRAADEKAAACRY